MARREVIITPRPALISRRPPTADPIPAPPPPPAPASRLAPGLRVCGHLVTRRQVCGTCTNIANNAAQSAHKPPKQPPEPLFRLPDGAVFHASYEEATETWTASLTVGADTLKGHGTSVHGILKWLGKRYVGFARKGPR